MRLLLAAALTLVAAAASPASADAPPDRGFARRPVASRPEPTLREPARYPGYARAVRPRRVYGPGPAFVPSGPRYGAEPVYFPGMGQASPNAGFGAFDPVPVAVTQYREAYIGRGLIYNVPPQPNLGSSNVISVRY